MRLKLTNKKIFHEDSHLIVTPDTQGAFQSFVYQKKVVDKHSGFQKIEVFETAVAGNVLVLDGVVQTTELDEFMYHEMLVHVPMFSITAPVWDVLIVGGGDGGSLREVLKHRSVRTVRLVDIDAEVIEIGRKYFGNGTSFDDPRVEIINADAADFIKKSDAMYDVAIIDCTDADTEGGKQLYNRQFMTALAKKMRIGGAVSMLSGVPVAQKLDHTNHLNEIMEFLGFRPYLYLTSLPSYYGGFTAIMLYMKGVNRAHPLRLNDGFDGKVKHYNAKLHEASFVLPNWIQEMLHGK